MGVVLALIWLMVQPPRILPELRAMHRQLVALARQQDETRATLARLLAEMTVREKTDGR